MKLQVGLGRDADGESTVALRLDGGTAEERTIIFTPREAEALAESLKLGAAAAREREAKEAKGRQ